VRRIFSSILILFVFCTLQYGKIATYLYCKWQAEVVLQLKDCGCETHLVSLFEHESGEGISATTIKEITVEYINEWPVNWLSPLSPLGSISSFAEYDSSLLQSCISPVFRPPVI
jgi:hypothetical protein